MLVRCQIVLFLFLSILCCHIITGVVPSFFGTNHYIHKNNGGGFQSNPLSTIATSFSQFIGSINEGISYHKSSASQYRAKLRQNVVNIFDRFRSSQSILSQQTQHEFELYMNQLNQIYSDTLASLQQQRNYIKELEKNIPSRPKQIDESLERFRKFYDESIVHKMIVKDSKSESTITISPSKRPPSSIAKTPTRPRLLKSLPTSKSSSSSRHSTDSTDSTKQKYSGEKPSTMKSLTKSIRKYFKSTSSSLLSSSSSSSTTRKEENIFRDVTRNIEETSASFSLQMDLLAATLGRQWSYLTHTIQDVVGTESTGEGGIVVGSQIQSQINSLLQEFTVFQEDVATRANDILKRSQQAIDESVNKTDILREKVELEKQLRTLERAVNAWVEDKFTAMETRVKTLQDKLKISNSLYEELVGKRQAEAAYSQLNDATLRRILGLIDPTDEGT